MNRQHEQALLLLRKAVADLALLEEVRESSRVSNELVGFHCQQAAEKLLKALLSEAGVAFPRTHSLRLLMDLLADAGHLLPADLAELDHLTPFATVYRYEDLPLESGLDRSRAVQMVRRLQAHVEQFLRP